jgi:hypothetical protein
MTEWCLRGNGSLERRQALLSSMFETARAKGSEVARLRQNNLSYALLLFGALFTVNLQFSKGWLAVGVSSMLFLFMIIVSVLDRRFHRYVHGWRQTEKHLIEKMVTLLNNPESDLSFRRYISEAELTAEKWAWQPCVTYILVAASLAYLAHTVILAV